MKVVRIIARLNVGGPARHVVWLTAGLRSESEQILVAGSVPSGEDDMSYFATANGVSPVYITELSREISWRDLISIWRIYRLLLREQPDIVHTHTAKAGTVGRIASLLYRLSSPRVLLGQLRPCKVVHTYHGHIFHSYYGPLKTRLFLFIERSLARLATDQIVVVSRQQRTEINETFGVGRKSQFRMIPLGLDLKQFALPLGDRQAFRERLGAKPEHILVGIVGRLTEIKNHQMFLQAIRVFRDSCATPEAVRFVVIGDGLLRQKLEKQASELGLGENVTFTGNLNDGENFYQGLDIVALTSRNEGTPLTLIEAMANARPVVATAVGGVVDLLGEPLSEKSDHRYVICERGISVPAGDVNAFVAGLARVVSNPELGSALGERGLRFVQQNYSKERLLKDVKDLYFELMQKTASVKARQTERRIESRV